MVKFKKPKKRVKKMRQKGKILSAADLAATLKEEDMHKDLGSRKRPKIDNDHNSGPSVSRKSDMTDWMDIDDVPGKNLLHLNSPCCMIASLTNFV